MENLYTPHKDLHKSGGVDAFTSTDVLEAAAKGLQTTTGPTILAMGAVADGEFLKRSGTSIVSGAAGAEAAANKVLRYLSFA